METGRTAESWLDQRLATDERWDDGIPDDAAPWVASAFADVASMSVDELTAAADEPPPNGEIEQSTTVPHLEATVDEAGLDDWLESHSTFETVDAELDFAVDDGSHAPTRLLDPFDDPSRGSFASDSVEASQTPDDLDLVDDIVTTGHHDAAPAPAPAPADVSDPAVAPDLTVTEPASGIIDLPESTFEIDGVELDLGDTVAAVQHEDSATDEADDDGLDQFDDGGWADD